MKATHYILSLLTALAGAVGMKAQDNNRLVLPDLTTLAGTTVALPLNMDNTAEVVAVEFDIQLPEGSTLDPTTSKLSNRAADHAVRFKAMGNDTYHCLIYSPTNSALLGRSGQLMTVNMHVSDAYEEGSEHEFALKNTVLALRDGSNGLTAVQAGKLIIQKGPDLTVEDTSADATTYAPGQTAVVSWQVKNIGALATGAGWTEYLSVRNAAGVTKLLATTSYDETLAAGGTVSRQVEVVLPAVLTLDGEAQFIVEVQPLAATGESQGLRWNNTAASTPVVFEKMLSLTLPKGSVQETYRDPIRCTLMRSGDRTAAETFTLAATEDSRITIPTTVTIPAGQSSEAFYIQLTDNTVLDDNGTIQITASGNGYPEASGQFEIEDNEYPDLNVTASTDNIYEGETFQLTVSATRAPKADLTVSFSAENATRFTFPATAVIPAGQTSVTVDVTVKDDDVPNLTFSNAFRANATGYNRGEAVVIVNDDDVPSLELLLTPNKVSEADGPIAVAATLRRTGVTNNKITVRLSDDTGGGIYYGRTEIVLEKGVEEAHLNLGPIDNATVDGDRVANITAAVYISSCSCNATGESAGVVTAQLTILDDDGPALKLTSAASTLLEGSSTTLTVGRNTADTTQPLTVTLSSDQDSRLTYEKLVTIPAGQTTATVALASQANAVQGDSFTAVFTATSEGFSSGTTYIMVTDQTLPDARITLTADKTEAEVGAEVTLTATVSNEGNAPLPAGTSVKVYTSSGTRNLTTSEALPIGGSETFDIVVTMPSSVGTSTCYATVNENSYVSELSHNNNQSASLSIPVIAPFSVSLSVDKDVYVPGETVVISGQATGSKVASQNVEVFIIADGFRKTLTATTDAAGNFQTSWTIQNSPYGQYRLGARFPGDNTETVSATFDILSLNVVTHDVQPVVNESVSGYFNVYNPCGRDLTGATIEALSIPDNCVFSCSLPSTLQGRSTSRLSYEIKATSASPGTSWQEIPMKLTTAEGFSMTVVLHYYALEPVGKLSTISYIETTMLKDASRDYEITLTNIGKGTTGDISIVLPNWMECVTGNNVAPLAYGESASVILRMRPTESMQLNVPQPGNIAINCTNAQPVSIPFSITPVSTEQGTLIVEVADEYTYTTAEAPHVKGASVVLRNPATSALVAEATTDENGLFTTTLTEGYYRLVVTSDNHDSYDGIIEISPERETRKTINLSVQAIEVGWEVKETTAMDGYELVTTVDFQTNVPVPVVELSVPKKLDVENLAVGESLIFYALLTNHGLIAAKDAALILPEGFKHITFEPLAEYTGLTIAPNVTVTIPVKVTRVSRPSLAKAKDIRRGAKPIDDDPCVGQPGTLYFWDCGLDRKWHRYDIAIQIGSCDSNDPSTWDPTPNPTTTDKEWTGGWPEGTRVTSSPSLPTFGTYGSYTSTPKTLSTTTEDKGCEPCQNSFLWKMSKCLIKRVPVVKEVLEFVDNVKCAYDVVTKLDNCWIEKLPIISTVTEWVELYDDCIKPLIEPCNPGDFSGTKAQLPWSISARNDIGGLHKKVKRQAQSTYPSYITEFQDKAAIVYDAIDAYMQQGLEICGESCWLDVPSETLAQIAQGLEAYADGSMSADELKALQPASVTEEQYERLLQRWFNTLEENNDENSINLQLIQEMEATVQKARDMVAELGEESISDFYVNAENSVTEKLQESTSSVCSSITLEFKQSVVMTRQAFEGTLTVFNGHETDAMQDVKLNLVVTGEDGDIATEREFDIRMKNLDGFGYSGQPSLTQEWTLEAGAKGIASVLFTPSKYAAPTEAKRYSFGGTLTYVDPFNGLEVTRILTPVTLTVNPTPDLVFTYFMQRDVLGDDPLTPDVVEPSVPAEFSLLINNIGYGDAKDVRMVTQQPEITVNEKGLMIDFHLTSSQLNGGQESPVIGSSTATKFGDIPAQSTAYAQWWFESSLLGHFTDYSLDIRPISYSNPDMSLINLEQSSVKELIRSIKIDNDGETLTGFLVNEIPDANDTPDMLYLTSGETADVAVAANVAVSKLSATDYELAVTPSAAGWNYGVVSDPTHGYSELASVVRKSDGREISLRNFWQTDRTLIDGKDWLYDNNLHFADNLGSGAETYVLTFEPTPEVVLEVASFSGIPAEGDIATEDVASVSVTFTKTIDPATFTADDITMNVQAERQDASLIGISTEDNKTFALDLTAINATAPNGYYTLAVQAADITDAEGFHGKNGKPATWILYRGGLVQLLTSAYPAVAGNVQRVTEAQVKGWRAPAAATEASAEYGSTVTLTATPNYGYEFSGWTLNGKPYGGSEPTLTTQAVGDMDIVANFRKKGYTVTIGVEGDGGEISGAGTGIYDYETQLTLTATPDEDYVFDGWVVDGQEVEGGATLTLTVTKTSDVSARFVRAFTPGDVNGDGEIDIADVMAMHAHILQVSPQNFNVRAADLNADGLVEIDDVMNLHSIILKKQLIKSHQSLYRSARRAQ